MENTKELRNRTVHYTLTKGKQPIKPSTNNKHIEMELSKKHFNQQYISPLKVIGNNLIKNQYLLTQLNHGSLNNQILEFFKQLFNLEIKNTFEVNNYNQVNCKLRENKESRLSKDKDSLNKDYYKTLLRKKREYWNFIEKNNN